MELLYPLTKERLAEYAIRRRNCLAFIMKMCYLLGCMNIITIQASLAKLAATVAILAASSTAPTTTLPTCVVPTYQSVQDTSAARAQAVADYKSKVQDCFTKREDDLINAIGSRGTGPDTYTIESALAQCLTQ